MIINNYTNMLNQKVLMDEVVEIQWDGDWSDTSGIRPYELYSQWVDKMINESNTYYYSKRREEFSKYDAFRDAAKYGKKFVILEDLS